MPIAAVRDFSLACPFKGAVIVTRNETNAEYYGGPVTPGQILYGKAKAPAGARKLQKALARY